MNQMTVVKKICVSAICIALCCILPGAFHSVGLGTTFSPMHIPVLLCGLLCGGFYGGVCGAMGPILSSLLTSMPGPAMLPSMVPELMVYGIVTGLLMRFVRTKKTTVDIYIALSCAMVAGRIVGGVAKALVYMGTGEAFSIGMWASGYFVATAPGIVCHLLLIPIVVLALMKARVVPNRYGKEG